MDGSSPSRVVDGTSSQRPSVTIIRHNDDHDRDDDDSRYVSFTRSFYALARFHHLDHDVFASMREASLSRVTVRQRNIMEGSSRRERKREKERERAVRREEKERKCR